MISLVLAGREKDETGVPPIYAEPSIPGGFPSPEKNVQMKSSRIYEMSKEVHMHPNKTYEDSSKL